MDAKEEAVRAQRAQAIANLKKSADWPYELELIDLKSKLVKARYDSLLRQGFNEAQALLLCVKSPEL